MTWMSLLQCSKYLGLSKETIYRMVYKKQIPFVRIGKVYRFNQTSIDKFFLKKETKAKRPS